MLKHTDGQVKGEEEVKDVRDHRWCSHQEVVRFELERVHEPVSQMEVQCGWQVRTRVHREDAI